MLRVIFLVVALAVRMIVTGSQVPAQVTRSSCVTDADSANSVRSKFQQMVAQGDSAGLARLGLPYRPVDNVSVVTDETTCGLAVSAFNALYLSDSAKYITRAVVVTVGPTRYVVWGVRPRSGVGGRDLFFVFDQTFQFIRLIA